MRATIQGGRQGVRWMSPMFVRDVGAAFATIGVAFLAAAPKALARRGVLLAATLFYLLHSLVHVADLVTGEERNEHV